MKISIQEILYEALLYAWEQEIILPEMIALCEQTQQEFLKNKLEEWTNLAIEREKNQKDSAKKL